MSEARQREEEQLRDGFVRVVFEIQKDEDGWPSVDREGLCTVSVGRGLYRIENSPFWFCGASYGDVVSVDDRNGKLFDVLDYQETLLVHPGASPSDGEANG